MMALAPALAAVTDTVRTTVASTKVSSAAFNRATRSITSTCLVMGVSFIRFTSPACGEVDALARARRVGEISPLGQSVLRRHPHPDPPRTRERECISVAATYATWFHLITLHSLAR